MSAVPADGIVGVSARYAAQIEELLYVRAIERMVAEEEAARAAAALERAERIESLQSTRPVRETEPPVKVEVEVRSMPDPLSLPEPAGASAAPPPATLVDVQA